MPGSFNPSNGLMRNALESTEQVPVNTGFAYHDFVSEGLTPLSEVIEQRSITRNAQRPVSAESKIGVGGPFEVDLNAEGHLRYLANLQRKYSVTNPDTGVYIAKLAPSATTAFAETMMVEVWRDDDMAALYKGGRVGSLALNLGLRQFFQATFNMVFSMADFWAYAANVAGSGDTPYLRGLPRYDLFTAADHDLYLKCVEASSFTFAAKVGAASSYGSDTFTMEDVGKWYEVIDSDGAARIGTKGLKVEAMFAIFNSLADDDEWRFDGERGEWVPTYPDVLPMNEVYAEIIVDGEEFRTNALTLNIERPVTPIYSIGGRFPKLVRERGRRQVGGTLNREYLDTSLVKKLLSAQSFRLEIVSETNVPIGSTAYYHGIRTVSPLCILSGPVPTIQSETQMDENLTFTCHPDPDDSGGDVDDISIYVTSTKTTPAA